MIFFTLGSEKKMLFNKLSSLNKLGSTLYNELFNVNKRFLHIFNKIGKQQDICLELKLYTKNRNNNLHNTVYSYHQRKVSY